MAASLETVRDKMKVAPTPEDKGLILILTVTAYDNGVLSVDDRPVSTIDPAHSWLSAHEVMGIAMSEFYRQFRARQKSKVVHLKVQRTTPVSK